MKDKQPLRLSKGSPKPTVAGKAGLLAQQHLRREPPAAGGGARSAGLEEPWLASKYSTKCRCVGRPVAAC